MSETLTLRPLRNFINLCGKDLTAKKKVIREERKEYFFPLKPPATLLKAIIIFAVYLNPTIK